MKKSQLISLFLTLNKKEVEECRSWLNAPIHNNRQDLIDLFEWLYLESKQETDTNFNKRDASKILYPTLKYSDLRIRSAMFHLSNAIQQYLVYENFVQQELDNEIQLISIYRQRGLEKLFNKSIKKIKRKQVEQPIRNAAFYQRDFLIHQEENTFIANRSRTLPMSLQAIGDALEINFIIEKLSQSCMTISHQNVYKTDYKEGMLHLVLNYIEQNNLLSNPAINLYYHCYKVLTAPNNAIHFSAFKKLIVKYKSLFPRKEIRSLYLIAINHCIQEANQGKAVIYLQELFDLYRLGIHEGFLLENGKLSRFTYRNTVSSGLKLKEFKWVFGFINQYKKHLEHKHQQSTYQYCLSRFYYESGDFQQATKLLQQTNYTDLISSLAAKTLLIKIYYERQEIDLLGYFLISFEAFIKRKKEIGYHKANYLNIIRLTKKMLNLAPYDDQTKLKLIAEIKNTQPLTERSWMLSQLA